jgi:protein O-mannosyl-transferase
MPDCAKRNRTTGLICVLLAFGTLLVYWPVFSGGFLNYDDPQYVTQNPPVRAGLTWDSVGWALTARHSSNWHPLTWISHMLDCELYGLQPAGHHATNLFFHVVNTLLLFLALKRMTGAVWRSAFVAALFALHPFHVESVAWVAERKDVLSTFLLLLTILAYARYVAQPRLARYLLVALLFALGLMAKPMLVTLPCLLLLLDFWPLRRPPPTVKVFGHEISIREPSGDQPAAGTPPGRLVLEKLPLLALSCASSAVTLWAQTESIVVNLPITMRAANAVLSCARYVAKTIWPVHLYVNYPYPRTLSILHLMVAAVLLGSASVLAIQHARARPYLLTGWFWFLVALLPVIGLLQVGFQSLADRYTYIPLIGLFIVLAWGGYDLAERWRLPPVAIGAAGVLVLGACIPLTIAQVSCWNNSVTLFEHALRFDRNNFIAQYNLAVTLMEQGKLDAAGGHFAAAAKVIPSYAQAHSSLGQVLIGQGRFEEAIDPYRTALRYNPKLAGAHYGLGVALHHRGGTAEATEHLMTAIELAPDFWEARDELGLVLAEEGRSADAVGHLSEAVRLAPKNPTYRLHLAAAWYSLGSAPEAVAQYREALTLSPDMTDALNNLAWILATSPKREIRNGDEAVRLAERACQLTQFRQAMMVGTLGVAYAEAGRFDEAVATAEKAAALAAAAGDTDVAGKSRAFAELFRSRQPLREEPPPAAAPATMNP